MQRKAFIVSVVRIIFSLVLVSTYSICWGVTEATGGNKENLVVCTEDYLREKIATAQEKDTVSLLCSNPVITISQPIFISKSLTIDGNGVTLDGKKKSRGFVIAKQTGRIIDGRVNPTPQQGGEGIHVVFKNMTWQNFYGKPLLYGSKTKSPQKTTDGSALYVGIWGHATVENIIAKYNTSPTDGGVIYIHGGDSGTLTVRNCIFHSNTAQGGGSAIASQQVRELTIEKTLFEKNTSFCTTKGCLKGERGGAVRIRAGGVLKVSDSVFSGNKANLGGAINILQAGFDIRRSKFTNNQSLPAKIVNHKSKGIIEDKKMTKTRGGGAIYADTSNKGIARIADSVFDANVGQMDGGAIYMFLRDAYLEIENATFTNNRVLKERGSALGIYGKALLKDTTFSGNTCLGGSKKSTCYTLYPQDFKAITLKNTTIEQE